MSYINVTIVGRVGKTPEVRMTATGKQITSCSVAAGNKDKTIWFNVQAWEQTGKWLVDAEKGDQVYISGTLEIGTYERKDGKAGIDPKINAQTIRVFKKGEKAEITERQASPAPADFDEDIPF